MMRSKIISTIPALAIVFLFTSVWYAGPVLAQNQASDTPITDKNLAAVTESTEAVSAPAQDFKKAYFEGIPSLGFDMSKWSPGRLNVPGLAWSETESTGMPTALSRALENSQEDAPAGMDLSNMDTPATGEWEYEIGTYLWMADVKADMGADDVVVEMDEEFKDTLEIVEWGAVLLLQARKDRWHIYTDLQYMALEDDERVGGIKIETTTRQAVTELAGGYRFGEREMFIEPLLGFRYFYLKNRINFSPGPSVDGTTDWLDLFVGGIFEKVFSEKWSFTLQGNAGGFGLGSGSDLTWVITTGLKWHITKKSYIGLGYRHMDIDYDHDDIVLDGYFTGPMIGYNYRF